MSRKIYLTEQQINSMLEYMDDGVGKKKHLTILWLDDVRDPEKYFSKKVEKSSGTLFNNISFYNDLREKYDLEFIWVKNFEEFTEYIVRNGLPDFVSFDHDLGKGLKKGAECAVWLKKYCLDRSLPLPNFYAHSANPNGRREINGIMSQTINEDVFADRTTIRGRKHKVVDLSYKMHSGPTNKNYGNLTPADMLGTEKMDKLDADTHIKMLKGGIKSYNITSIKGEEVMHYFKRKYARDIKPTTLKVNGEEYELNMDDAEFQYFTRMFNEKVNRVINYCINEFRKENKKYAPVKVSIYPVPSSENFNKAMAEIMGKMSLAGLPVQVIDDALFKKDLRNIAKDEDFIAKNKEFYRNRLADKTSVNGYDKPVELHVEDDVRKLKAFSQANRCVAIMHETFARINQYWASYKFTNSLKTLESLARLYARYYDANKACTNLVSYQNFARKEGDDAGFQMRTIANTIKNIKGRPVDPYKSAKIWNAVEPILKDRVSPSTGKPYKRIDLIDYEPKNFQMKNLTNGERMGLKNYYNPNEDAELVQRELERIKGGVFVIFDDNISGGATLSDICFQCKQLGIQYIIPITFGEMAEKWTMNYVPLNKPRNTAGEEGKFNYK